MPLQLEDPLERCRGRSSGHTWSRNGTGGISAKIRSRLEPHRVVAGVHDLLGASCVGVLDDRFRVVLGSEGRGHVGEPGPLEHQLDGQLLPGLGPVAHDDPQLREVVTDLVEVHDVLALRRYPRARDAGIDHDGDIEVNAGLIDRVVAPITHRDLWVAARRKRRHGHDAVFRMGVPNAAHRFADVVRIDFETRHEATRDAARVHRSSRDCANRPDRPQSHACPSRQVSRRSDRPRSRGGLGRP